MFFFPRFISDYMRTDGMVVLKLIRLNMGVNTATEIIVNLFDKFRELNNKLYEFESGDATIRRLSPSSNYNTYNNNHIHNTRPKAPLAGSATIIHSRSHSGFLEIPKRGPIYPNHATASQNHSRATSIGSLNMIEAAAAAADAPPQRSRAATPQLQLQQRSREATPSPQHSLELETLPLTRSATQL